MVRSICANASNLKLGSLESAKYVESGHAPAHCRAGLLHLEAAKCFRDVYLLLLLVSLIDTQPTLSASFGLARLSHIDLFAAQRCHLLIKAHSI